MMTFIAVFGYTAVGFLSIWQLSPRASDFWLPALAAVHVIVMTALGLSAGRGFARGRSQTGLLGIACGAGNNGLTMGGFIIYMLYGESGLGMVTIYSLAWMPMTVLLFYPIARHFAAGGPPVPLARLMFRSIFDWRSIGLPVSLLGLALAWMGVPRPAVVGESHIVDILMFMVNAIAYMAIGLRLHATDILSLKRAIAGLAAMRFGAGLLVGLGLAALTLLTPWPLEGLALNVFVIEAFVPTAVTMVAVANMFNLLPRQASAMFIVNTAMYLLLVLPVVLWFFGGR
jgi:predicted permease